jgi:predicted nucleic acid-binding protein
VLVAFLGGREEHHAWARRAFGALPTPWLTCDAVLTETCHLLEGRAATGLRELLRGENLRLAFDLEDQLGPVLDLMDKYADVPMSLADACVVRMSEILRDPLVLTADQHFRIYRRHSRQIVPCLMP